MRLVNANRCTDMYKGMQCSVFMGFGVCYYLCCAENACDLPTADIILPACVVSSSL